MGKTLKIVLVVITILLAIFALAKIAVSFTQKYSLRGGSSFTVKKSGSLGNIIFLASNLSVDEKNLPSKINFLVLGKPGEGNNAPDLTDTIILVTLKPDDKKIFFFSIPRDLYVRIDDFNNFTKINALYEIGESQSPDFPAKYIIKSIEKISGEKIDYFLAIDLVFIKKIVDDLGGLNVNVSQSVDDPKFPTANNGYEMFHIEKGWRYFDGETTLKYLRTRHSPSGDFDRMQRQQDIVEAFRKKIFGLNIILDFPKILKIYSDMDNHITTNIDVANDAKMFHKTLKSIPPENLIYKVINTDTSSGLVTTDNINVGGGVIASVVRPKRGLEDYEDIREFIGQTIGD